MGQLHDNRWHILLWKTERDDNLKKRDYKAGVKPWQGCTFQNKLTVFPADLHQKRFTSPHCVISPTVIAGAMPGFFSEVPKSNFGC